MARQVTQTEVAVASDPEERPFPRHGVWVGMLTVALLLAILVSLGVGAVGVPARKLVLALLGRESLTTDQRIIIISLRLPRILAAAVVGSALSVSGLLFQGLFRNPLADPYVIGSSGGAVLGASVGVFLLPSVTVAGFGATALLGF